MITYEQDGQGHQVENYIILNRCFKEVRRTSNTDNGFNVKMSTYTQIIYQIVFGTRRRERTLTKPNREELYKYISGVIQNKKCHLYRIGGVEDHIHILTHLHPTVALADLVKDIKMSSSDYIKRNKLFPNFNGWSEGYGAFTYHTKQKDILIEYIKNQEEHHKISTFKAEYLTLLQENNVEYSEKFVP